MNAHTLIRIHEMTTHAFALIGWGTVRRMAVGSFLVSCAFFGARGLSAETRDEQRVYHKNVESLSLLSDQSVFKKLLQNFGLKLPFSSVFENAPVSSRPIMGRSG